MVANSVALAVGMLVSVESASASFAEKLSVSSETAKVAGAFLVASGVRAVYNNHRQLPVKAVLVGQADGNEVERLVQVGSYGLTTTNPVRNGDKELSVVQKILKTEVGVKGFTVGNVLKDAVLAAVILKGAEVAAPAVSKFLSRK